MHIHSNYRESAVKGVTDFPPELRTVRRGHYDDWRLVSAWDTAGVIIKPAEHVPTSDMARFLIMTTSKNHYFGQQTGEHRQGRLIDGVSHLYDMNAMAGIVARPVITKVVSSPFSVTIGEAMRLQDRVTSPVEIVMVEPEHMMGKPSQTTANQGYGDVPGDSPVRIATEAVNAWSENNRQLAAAIARQLIENA